MKYYNVKALIIGGNSVGKRSLFNGINDKCNCL
jgi:hypothetical protein